MRTMIGHAALLHFRIQVLLGRFGYALAARYGAIGLGGIFGAEVRRNEIITKYGLAGYSGLNIGGGSAI